MEKLFRVMVTVLVMVMCAACSKGSVSDPSASADGAIKLDPVTGVPYALTFQFPVSEFDTGDFGFGFGAENTAFCLESSGGSCVSYGYHLARDTRVVETPVGKIVVAPADGIVRLTTDATYGGYGSDTASNADYRGCLILLEHEFQNGQRVTSLLGHLECEAGAAYDATAKSGNPAVGALVQRGQYLGHVNHYWSGSTQTVDWHHLHWGMRRGAFVSGNAATYVRGYAKKSEFVVDPSTGIWTHPEWVDPFTIVAANGDPAAMSAGGVHHHPSGSLLEDRLGSFWLVVDDAHLAQVPPTVMSGDRYDPMRAVRVTDEEIGCYNLVASISALGSVTLYKRPGSSTVVMAYGASKTRYDVIRWEALLSWGFDGTELITDTAKIQQIETTYAPKGFRLLRPGTLVKANEQSEVAIVTAQQTRLPIASANVFQDLGFAWEHVVSIPFSVLDQVAGARESVILDAAAIQICKVSSCPGGGTCGGGDPEQPPTAEICNGLDDDGDGQIDEIFQCKMGAIDGPPCVSVCGTSGQRVCEAPNCAWGSCKPFAESCSNGLDDDCNGLMDCADPACVAAPECQVSMGDTVMLHLQYQGPPMTGSIMLMAWWQPPNATVRAWGQVPECVDVAPSDGVLNCTFPVASGSSPFEFQLNLPAGHYWGDKSCTTGGCGSTVGNLTISGPNGLLPVTLAPNNSDGLPYFNGHIEKIF